MSKYLIAPLILLLLACRALQPSTDRISCENSDWYEIGRRDGASGSGFERLIGYKQICGNRLDEQNEIIYRNGRNAGLNEYCSGRNGYELGRMNVKYKDVCPSIMEEAFLKSYSAGEKARGFEQTSKKLSDRITELTQRLSNDQDLEYDERTDIRAEIENLRKQLAANERQLDQVK